MRQLLLQTYSKNSISPNEVIYVLDESGSVFYFRNDKNNIHAINSTIHVEIEGKIIMFYDTRCYEVQWKKNFT